MTYYLKFEAEALENIASSIDYYESISRELANRFRSILKALFDDLEQNPNIYQVRYKDIHIGLTESFSFAAHYRVSGDSVVILKVMHTRKNY